MLSPNTILRERYRIIHQLGQGGMGAVYQAMDENLSCIVAVKETFAANDDGIAFSLKPGGAERLGNWTGANIDKYLGIVLNNEVKSIGAIKSQISDHFEITGRFSEQSAMDTAHILNSGALPTPVKIVDESANRLKKDRQ